MQKVEGSSPFIRFRREPRYGGGFSSSVPSPSFRSPHATWCPRRHSVRRRHPAGPGRVAPDTDGGPRHDRLTPPYPTRQIRRHTGHLHRQPHIRRLRLAAGQENGTTGYFGGSELPPSHVQRGRGAGPLEVDLRSARRLNRRSPGTSGKASAAGPADGLTRGGSRGRLACQPGLCWRTIRSADTAPVRHPSPNTQRLSGRVRPEAGAAPERVGALRRAPERRLAARGARAIIIVTQRPTPRASQVPGQNHRRRASLQPGDCPLTAIRSLIPVSEARCRPGVRTRCSSWRRPVRMRCGRPRCRPWP